jgi:hypothetical protein
MKKILFQLFMFSALLSNAQAPTQLPEPDKSPLDICYFPVNYPLLKIQDQIKEPPVARVIYSRPKKEGRPVFGNLVEYGKLWRLGANEATEIEFFRPVTIGGKKIAKGRYTLFAIVNEKNWTLIVNKDTDVWGSFRYNKAKDLVRIEVPVKKMEEPTELLSMTFEKTNNRLNLIIAWETTRVELPILL